MMNRPPPLPRQAVTTAMVAVLVVTGAYFVFGFAAAGLVALAVVLGWAIGVLHERHGARPEQIADPDDDRAMVVTLSPKAAQVSRTLSEKQKVSVAEVVRRGLMLLNLFANLEPEEDLLIVDRETRVAKRIRPPS